MKTKFIVISLGVLLIITVIFLVQNQKVSPQPEESISKITQFTTPQKKPIPSEKLEPKLVEREKVSSLGKMPDPSDMKALEEFYAKALAVWNEKVANLIINELKLGQDALDKYHSIRDNYYLTPFSLFQVQTSQEPEESQNREGQKRLVASTNRAKEILENDFGINLENDEINVKEDSPKIAKAIERALEEDLKNFHTDHLNQIKGVLGNDGFKKYEKLKEDFNSEVTEEGSEPMFKI